MYSRTAGSHPIPGDRNDRTSLSIYTRQARGAFLLALAVATVIAGIDLALGADTILTGALVAAPLVACVRAGPRLTAVAWAYAVALALTSGIWNDQFASADHLARVLTLVLGGGLAVYVAKLRSEREHDNARLRTQYAVARIVSEETSLETAAPRLLAALGGNLDWQVGGFWEVRPGEALRYVTGWTAPGFDSARFHDTNQRMALRKGVGLPGMVWERNLITWLPDVLTAENFARVEAAGEAGLRCGVGFPVHTRAGAVGVMELFADRVRAQDDEQLELLAALGAQVGEFVDGLHFDEALRTSEARTRAVVTAALDCVISMDHRGRVIDFNPAAEEVFGYRAEDVKGKEMAELIVPPALRDAHRAGLRRHIETGEEKILGKRLEMTAVRADGTEFPVDLAITRLGTGPEPTFTGYLRDISERKSAEDEREELLRLEQMARLEATQAREQLEAILRGVADGVTAQAPDGSLLFANAAAVETLGYDSADELLNAPLGEIMSRFEVFDAHGEPFPIDQLPGRHALEGKSGAEALLRFRIIATGEERWSVVKATPIVNTEGEVVMAINVFEDITAHRRAAQEQQFLSESTRILASSLDPDETLRQVAQLAVPEIADWCAVDLAGEDSTIERVALVHADPELLAKAESLRERYPPDPKSETGVARILETGESQLYPEIPEELLEQGAVDEEHLELIREFGLRSAMAVPMIARDAVIGVLTFASGPSGRRFAAEDLRVAEELGRRCATAIDNSRVYAERDYIARALQRSLLPAELPLIPGLETAARFRATGEGNEVGGDFYDLFETGGRGWTRRDRRRLRQGPGRRGGDRARPVHAARGRHARAPPQPQPAAAQRRAPSPTRRPPLLHRRLRVPRGPRGGRAGRLRQRRPSPAGDPARGRRGRVARRARDAAGGRAGPALRGPLGGAVARGRGRLLYRRRHRGRRAGRDPRRGAPGRRRGLLRGHARRRDRRPRRGRRPRRRGGAAPRRHRRRRPARGAQRSPERVRRRCRSRVTPAVGEWVRMF